MKKMLSEISMSIGVLLTVFNCLWTMHFIYKHFATVPQSNLAGDIVCIFIKTAMVFTMFGFMLGVVIAERLFRELEKLQRFMPYSPPTYGATATGAVP